MPGTIQDQWAFAKRKKSGSQESKESGDELSILAASVQLILAKEKSQEN